MIKKYYNIITICILLMNAGSFLFSAGCSNCSRSQNNFEIILNIINTPQFSFSNWNDPLVDLWSMTLINNQACATTPHYDSEVQIEMLLEDNSGEAMIWAVTDPLIIPCGGGSRTLYNSDFLNEQVRNGLDQYLYNKVFHDDLTTNIGYLPAGQYVLTLNVYRTDEVVDDAISSYNLESGGICNSIDTAQHLRVCAQESITTVVSTQVELSSPEDGSTVSEDYPTFYWYTPGFRSGITIEYKIKIAQFNPNDHDTYEQALGQWDDDIDENPHIFFDSGWPSETMEYSSELEKFENGVPQLASIKYPTGDLDLQCGYDYVWQVYSREVSQGVGLWGFPEPIVSPIYLFNVGSKIASESIESPQISSVQNSIRPLFSFFLEDQCASEYEIWLSDSEDPEVQNPIWEGVFPSTTIQYPIDADGLVPGKNYFWKVRMNPNANPSPWSDVFDFEIMEINYSDISSNSLLPEFNAELPEDAFEYEIYLSDDTDYEADQANIFSSKFSALPYTYPADAQTLIPGATYYWKFLLWTTNDLAGSPSDYPVSMLSIDPVEIASPSNGISDQSIYPIFTWDGPIGVGGYELFLSDSSDPNVDNPLFTISLGSSQAYEYSEDNEYKLSWLNTYYWKINALSRSGDNIMSSEVFSFNTASSESEVSSEVSKNKPEIELSVNELGEINIEIVISVLNAIEYKVELAKDQNFNNIVSSGDLSRKGNFVFNKEVTDWGKTYYVRAIAVDESDEQFGEYSTTQVAIIPDRPGSKDQVGLVISLTEGSNKPNIEITNTVTQAEGYMLYLSDDSDLANELQSFDLANNLNFNYPIDGVVLNYGQTYYFQANAYIENESHGIPSSINSLFIPNIISASLKEEPFAWTDSKPQSHHYSLEVSLTEDFNTIYFSQDNIEGASYPYQESKFDPGTDYYWRIQGFDESNNIFGPYSNVGYFKTSGDPPKISDYSGSEQTMIKSPSNGSSISTTTPNFQWNAFEGANKYEINVSSSEDFSEISWKSLNVASSSITYPSNGAVELNSEKKYFWRVRAISGTAAISLFSEVFSFEINSNFTPILTGPISKTSESTLPLFTWERVPKSKSYNFKIGTTEDLSSPIIDITVTGEQYIYSEEAPPLQYGLQYFWQVTANNQEGIPLGDPSPTASFNTPQGVVEIELKFGF